MDAGLELPHELTTYAAFQAYAKRLAAALHRGEISMLDWEIHHDAARNLLDQYEKEQLLRPPAEQNRHECPCGSATHYKGQKKEPARHRADS